MPIKIMQGLSCASVTISFTLTGCQIYKQAAIIQYRTKLSNTTLYVKRLKIVLPGSLSTKITPYQIVWYQCFFLYFRLIFRTDLKGCFKVTTYSKYAMWFTISMRQIAFLTIALGADRQHCQLLSANISQCKLLEWSITFAKWNQ